MVSYNLVVTALLAASYLGKESKTPFVQGGDEWKAYKMKFKKVYNDPSEDLMRQYIYERSKIENEKFNAEMTGSSWGINQFSDLTDEEIKKYMGARGDKIKHRYSTLEAESEAARSVGGSLWGLESVPWRVDWREVEVA